MFYFNGVRRSIAIDEALILSGWLHRTRSLAADPLARRIDAETDATDRPWIELSPGLADSSAGASFRQ